MAYADGALVQRNLATGATVRTFPAEHAVQVNALAFSPDGAQLISGDNSGKAALWNLANAAVLFRYTHPSAVNAVAFSPTNPQRVATGSSDNYARLWSTVTGALVQEFGPVFNAGVLIAGHAGPVNALAFSADGSIIATGSDDKRVKLWRVSNGTEAATLPGRECRREICRFFA